VECGNRFVSRLDWGAPWWQASLSACTIFMKQEYSRCHAIRVLIANSTCAGSRVPYFVGRALPFWPSFLANSPLQLTPKILIAKQIPQSRMMNLSPFRDSTILRPAERCPAALYPAEPYPEGRFQAAPSPEVPYRAACCRVGPFPVARFPEGRFQAEPSPVAPCQGARSPAGISKSSIAGRGHSPQILNHDKGAAS